LKYYHKHNTEPLADTVRSHVTKCRALFIKKTHMTGVATERVTCNANWMLL